MHLRLLSVKIFYILFYILLVGCQTTSRIKTHTFRLMPGEDLKTVLQKYVDEKNLKASSIVTAVGSLTQARLRMANQSQATDLKGPFEIVSMVGLLSTSGSHIHLAISDATGKTTGGHLVEGNLIYTTCEVTVLENESLTFDRELDPKTGYKELSVKDR